MYFGNKLCMPQWRDSSHTSCLTTEAGDCSIVLLIGILSRVSKPEL